MLNCDENKRIVGKECIETIGSTNLIAESYKFCLIEINDPKRPSPVLDEC